MTVIPAMESALFGLRTSLDHLEGTARRIARVAPAGDLAGDMVDLIRAQRTFEANVATVRSGDRMIGEMLDVLA